MADILKEIKKTETLKQKVISPNLTINKSSKKELYSFLLSELILVRSFKQLKTVFNLFLFVFKGK